MGKSPFKSKLARLRREGAAMAAAAGREPVPSDPAPQDSVPTLEEVAPSMKAAVSPSSQKLPSWVGARLARRRDVANATMPVTSSTAVAMTAELQRIADCWETSVGDPSELRSIERAEGSFAVREKRIQLGSAEPGGANFQHGAWRLDEIDGADPAAIARLARDEALAGIDLRRAIYLDTETSGLSGGAGVYVYMVGLGWFEGDTYVSWQSFLRHPGEERAMLAEVADRIRTKESLVSFFGKSFDRHRLEDKMQIAGVEPPFEGRPHLDLYHPFKRLTHGAFPNGKLQTMERELLGFHRAKDLPGSLAPAAWFDYLAGRPHRLEGVFLHNHEDVLSLVVLAAFLGRATTEQRASGEPLAGPRCRRAAALAETAPDHAERLRWAEEALARDAQGADRRRMQLLAAELHRRAGNLDEARAAYRSALEECSDDRTAVDLFAGASMLLEHGLRDMANALAMAERAQKLGLQKGLPKGLQAALSKRVARLTSKSKLGSQPKD